jgi:hypothetical protein
VRRGGKLAFSNRSLTTSQLVNRIFCHSQNLFWTFEQLDVDAIEAPKVPSGMTGGVEYEAMAYAVSLTLAAEV